MLHYGRILQIAIYLLVGQAIAGFVPESHVAEYRNLTSPIELPKLGAFVFPEPYNTMASRITNPLDYDSNYFISPDVFLSSNRPITNNHAQSNVMYVLYSIFEGKIGGNYYLYLAKVNKKTLSLIWMKDLGRISTAREYYFSFTDPWKFYYFDGKALLSGSIENEVFSSGKVEFAPPDSDPWPQKVYFRAPSTSANDQVHAIEVYVPNGIQPKYVGCYIQQAGVIKRYQLANDSFIFSCTVDKSGEYVVMRGHQQFTLIKVDDMSESTIDIGDQIVRAYTVGYRALVYQQQNSSFGMSSWYSYYAVDFNDKQPNLVYQTEFEVGPFQQAASDAETYLSWNHAVDRPMADQAVCRLLSKGSIPYSSVNEIGCFKLDGSQQFLAVAPVYSTMYDAKYAQNMVTDQTGQFVLWNAIRFRDTPEDLYRSNAFIATVGEITAVSPLDQPQAPSGGPSIGNIPDWAWAVGVILFVVIIGAWVGLAIWITRVKFRIRDRQR